MIEDHHDDRGEDLTSLTGYLGPCDYDTDEELSDQDHNVSLQIRLRNYQRVFPIDPATVAQPQEGQPGSTCEYLPRLSTLSC